MTVTWCSISKAGLLGPNEVYVTDSVVSEEEQVTLFGWADQQYRHGKLFEIPRNPGAYSTAFHSASGQLTRFTNANAQSEESSERQKVVWVPAIDDQNEESPPEAFWTIRSRVIELMGLSELEEDPYKGSFLSYIAPGAGIHWHRDDRLKIEGQEHLVLRCNVLFKRPQQGGLPVLESTEIEVHDRGMWVFFPTELFHAATPVSGSDFRGLLSFGFLVQPDDLWHRRFRLAPRFERDYGLGSGARSRRALLDQLRSGATAQGISEVQLQLLEVVLLSSDDFSVHDMAQSIGRRTSETMEGLQGLQRVKVVESYSSTCAARGRVMVL